MIIITNWNEILVSHLSVGLEKDIQIFYKELVHDNMGEDYLTYDFTEIGKIAILESSDDIDNLLEIGFYADTMLLLNKVVESVDDVWIDETLYYRVTVLLNDAEGVVLYVESKVHGEEMEEWIKQGKEDMICNGLS